MTSGGESVTVLAVSPAGRDRLRRILGHSRWTLVEADTLAEAFAVVRNQPALVLICEATLLDGTWQDLLAYTRQLPVPPPVLVASFHADDHLWMDVLNQGGYNVLREPFEEQDVFRMVSMAWRYRNDQARTAAAPGL